MRDGIILFFCKRQGTVDQTDGRRTGHLIPRSGYSAAPLDNYKDFLNRLEF